MKCDNCEAPLSSEDNYCSKCGEPTSATKEEHKKEHNHGTKNNWNL